MEGADAKYKSLMEMKTWELVELPKNWNWLPTVWNWLCCLTSIRSLLAFTVEKGMLIHQMDVVTAFLNGQLEEEIYNEQPPDHVQPEKEHLVCGLQRSLIAYCQGNQTKLSNTHWINSYQPSIKRHLKWSWTAHSLAFNCSEGYMWRAHVHCQLELVHQL